MFNKIAIRNIPSQIFRALEALADFHDRSTEAEARQALRACVEPSLAQESRHTRRQGVAERLNRMLAQFNAGRRGTKLTTSHIAEAIKEERAEDVEDWFLGDKEPSFPQLSAIAKFLGVDPDWLKHGDKAPYPPEYECFSENPFETVDWLLSWNPAENQDAKVKILHLIRADGGLYIVKESDQGHFLTFYTSIHVSEEIGAGGEASLAALFVTLELLYKRYTALGSGIMVLGYQLRPDDIAHLFNGADAGWVSLHGVVAPRNRFGHRFTFAQAIQLAGFRQGDASGAVAPGGAGLLPAVDRVVVSEQDRPGGSDGHIEAVAAVHFHLVELVLRLEVAQLGIGQRGLHPIWAGNAMMDWNIMTWH